MDIYPGQSAPADSEYASRYGMFRRVVGGTLHLLPLNGGYESKRDENGDPVFVLTKLTPRRDDVYHDNPNDVQHAGRLAERQAAEAEQPKPARRR